MPVAACGKKQQSSYTVAAILAMQWFQLFTYKCLAHAGYDSNDPNAAPPQPPSAWQHMLHVVGGIMHFFGRLSFLVDENAHAVHFFVSALLQLLDRCVSGCGSACFVSHISVLFVFLALCFVHLSAACAHAATVFSLTWCCV